MKKAWVWMPVLLLLLAGCEADFLPERHEIEDTLLLRTLGADAAPEGVAVTASSGVQSKGVGEGREPPRVFGGRAGTVSGACLSLQKGADAQLFFGHVGQLLLGEGLARENLTAPLGYVERDVEMRLDTELYVVRGATAAQAIGQAATPDASAADRLEALEEGEGAASPIPRTVKDVLSSLARNGAAFAGAVTPGEEGTLISAGYALFKKDALVGWADGEAARGVNLALGRVEAEVLEVGPVALRLVAARTDVRPVFAGETLVGLTLDCTVEANIAQAPPEQDFARGEALERLHAALSATVERRLRLAVALGQSLNADFLGLGRSAGLSAPWRWAAIEAQWGPRFSTLPVSIRVESDILRGYDIKG